MFFIFSYLVSAHKINNFCSQSKSFQRNFQDIKKNIIFEASKNPLWHFY
jgi:hypothetical protein